MSTQAPRITPELINYLSNQYSPERVREIKTQEDLRYLQGQLNVVDALRVLFEYQRNSGNILNVPTKNT